MAKVDNKYPKIPPSKDDFNRMSPSAKIIIWIDANVKSQENTKTFNYIYQNLDSPVVFPVKTIKDAIEIMKRYTLRIVHVVLSGALTEDFMNEYEKIIKSLHILVFTIIYCGNKKYQDYKKFVNDHFFNLGGVATELKELMKFLKTIKNDYKEPKTIKANSKALTKDLGKYFKEIQPESWEELSKPAILGKYLNDNYFSFDDYKKYVGHIDKYDNSVLSYYVYPMGNLNVKLPYYINSEFWLKMTTLQSPYFVDMLKDLTNSDGKTNVSIYNPFIFSLYLGLKEGYIQSYSGDLFSAQILKEEEYQSIKEKFEKSGNSSAPTYQLKTFMDCFKLEDVAGEYYNCALEKASKAKKTKAVFFKIEGLPGKESFFLSNADIGSLSECPEEEEVLVFPYSVFEVVDVQEGKNTVITLKYPYEKEKNISDFIKTMDPSKEVFNFMHSDNHQHLYDSPMIVWIDQFAKCKTYEKDLDSYFVKKDLKDYQMYKVNSVEKGYELLKLRPNKKAFVIVSQYYAEEFFDAYQEMSNKYQLNTVNTVLCENSYVEIKKNFQKKLQEKGYLNNPQINTGGFVEKFQDVLSFIKKQEEKPQPKIKTKFGVFDDNEEEQPKPQIKTKFGVFDDNEEEQPKPKKGFGVGKEEDKHKTAKKFGAFDDKEDKSIPKPKKGFGVFGSKEEDKPQPKINKKFGGFDDKEDKSIPKPKKKFGFWS